MKQDRTKTDDKLEYELIEGRNRVNELDALEGDRKRLEAELRDYAAQQAVLSQLSLHAFRETDLQALMEEKKAVVLEIPPEADALLLRAGVGWMPQD
ncbi:MAG: hypothetical protein V3U24_10615 [Candidatus Neomarinimicrobiota bacterium]